MDPFTLPELVAMCVGNTHMCRKLGNLLKNVALLENKLLILNKTTRKNNIELYEYQLIFQNLPLPVIHYEGREIKLNI